MRKVRMFEPISVDGYFNGSNSDMSWAHAAREDAEFAGWVSGTPPLTRYFRAASPEMFRLEHVKESERRPRRPEVLTVHCDGYGAMPSGLVFRGNTGTDGIFPRNCGAEISRQSPHCRLCTWT